jgi:hypothetical protein
MSNKTVCWYCGKEFSYDGEQYRDVVCVYCHIMNSVYKKGEDMAKPPKRAATDFEKVKIGEFVNGKIDKIEYENEHTFKGFGDKKDSVSPAVRIVFLLDGYEYPHRTRWMRFMYGEKSNLYKKFMAKLVEGAKPDMDFDLDLLIGLRVKTIWAEQNDFQSIESIFPEDKKVVPGEVKEESKSTEETWLDETEDQEQH